MCVGVAVDPGVGSAVAYGGVVVEPLRGMDGELEALDAFATLNGELRTEN
ncbi:MAG: hypothetical protein II661_04535 [Bacteroidales bacterium]|nr:hypothetical protein [Bacteroidales bacterium]